MNDRSAITVKIWMAVFMTVGGVVIIKKVELKLLTNLLKKGIDNTNICEMDIDFVLMHDII